MTGAAWDAAPDVDCVKQCAAGLSEKRDKLRPSCCFWVKFEVAMFVKFCGILVGHGVNIKHTNGA